MVNKKKKTRVKKKIKVKKHHKNKTSKRSNSNTMYSKFKGSLETLGNINYHYQKYDNTFSFFDKLMEKDDNMKRLLCIPDVGDKWMRSFLKVILDENDLDTSELMVQNVEPVDPLISVEKFNEMVRKCDKRFIAVSVQLIVHNKPGSHANMIIIDKVNKSVELFEPHGNRPSDTSMDSLEGAYKISNKLVKKYFEKYFPQYEYISPKDYLPTYGLQAKVDVYNGMCVTWCILYLHFRILNPNKTQQQLINKLKRTIDKPYLLRYAKKIENTLKGK